MIKGKVQFVPLKKSLLFPISQSRIDQYFADTHKSRYADEAMVPETVVLLWIVIITPYVLLLVFTPLLAVSFLWLRMCAGISGIRISVMHNAGHRTFCQRPRLNNCMGRTIYLADAGVVNRKTQHNVLHHTYVHGFFFVIPVFAARIVFSQPLPGLLIMLFVVGLVWAAIFQRKHLVEGTNYPLRNDFLPGFFYACYPELTPTVRNTAEEFGGKYQEKKTLFTALRAHHQPDTLRVDWIPGYNRLSSPLELFILY